MSDTQCLGIVHLSDVHGYLDLHPQLFWARTTLWTIEPTHSFVAT